MCLFSSQKIYILPIATFIGKTIQQEKESNARLLLRLHMYVKLEWLLNFCVLMVFNENLSL
jgi:hypothetical protein